MQVCTTLQTDNHASTPPLSFSTGWMHPACKKLSGGVLAWLPKNPKNYFTTASWGPLKKKKIQGALGTCPVCPLAKTALVVVACSPAQ